MSAYTPPALNAVDFALEAFTPASIVPATMALSVYTVPSLSAVDFALTSYTVAARPYVGWEMLPTGGGAITGTIATTDVADTAIVNGNINHVGYLAATDGVDTAYFDGNSTSAEFFITRRILGNRVKLFSSRSSFFNSSISGIKAIHQSNHITIL